MRSPSYKFLETATFYHIFISFLFQTNTDLLLIHQNSNDFTQETLYLSFISKKNGALHRKGFSKHPLFTTFSLFLTVRFAIFQTNTGFIVNQLKPVFTQTLYTLLHFKKEFTISILEVFTNIKCLPHLYQFSQWMRCAIFQINTNLLVIQQNINIFAKETLYPSFISKKKIGVLHRKRFSKHSLLSTFSLFLMVSEVCNISNKY